MKTTINITEEGIADISTPELIRLSGKLTIWQNMIEKELVERGDY